MTIEEIIKQIETVAGKFEFIRNVIRIDVTDFSAKYRLVIAEDFYVQVYVNITKGTTGFALVFNGQRLYGRDSEEWKWHRHPFESPGSHDFSDNGRKEVTLEEFLWEVQSLLEKAELL